MIAVLGDEFPHGEVGQLTDEIHPVLVEHGEDVLLLSGRDLEAVGEKHTRLLLEVDHVGPADEDLGLATKDEGVEGKVVDGQVEPALEMNKTSQVKHLEQNPGPVPVSSTANTSKSSRTPTFHRQPRQTAGGTCRWPRGTGQTRAPCRRTCRGLIRLD